MEKQELQSRLDVEKWLLSENRHLDLCGSFGYCGVCDKAKQHPCASAMLKKDNAEKPKTQLDANGYPVNVKVRSFTEKLAGADEILQERYEAIQNMLLSFAKVTHRVSEKCDNYRAGRGNLIAKITITGKSLRVNFPLNQYDEKYADRKMPHRDSSAIKAYATVPFQFIVTSNLALRRCFTLIDDVATLKGLVKKNHSVDR